MGRKLRIRRFWNHPVTRPSLQTCAKVFLREIKAVRPKLPNNVPCTPPDTNASSQTRSGKAEKRKEGTSVRWKLIKTETPSAMQGRPQAEWKLPGRVSGPVTGSERTDWSACTSLCNRKNTGNRELAKQQTNERCAHLRSGFSSTCAH